MRPYPYADLIRIPHAELRRAADHHRRAAAVRASVPRTPRVGKLRELLGRIRPRRRQARSGINTCRVPVRVCHEVDAGTGECGQVRRDLSGGVVRRCLSDHRTAWTSGDECCGGWVCRSGMRCSSSPTSSMLCTAQARAISCGKRRVVR